MEQALFCIYLFIQHQFRSRTFPWDSRDPAEPPCILPDRREFQFQSPPSLQVSSLTHPLPWIIGVFLTPRSEDLVLVLSGMKTKMPNPDFLRKCDLFFLGQPMGRVWSTLRSRADTLPAREAGVQLQGQLCLDFSLSPRMSDCPSVT